MVKKRGGVCTRRGICPYHGHLGQLGGDNPMTSVTAGVDSGFVDPALAALVSAFGSDPSARLLMAAQQQQRGVSPSDALWAGLSRPLLSPVPAAVPVPALSPVQAEQRSDDILWLRTVAPSFFNEQGLLFLPDPDPTARDPRLAF
jgi:hypothetical protein